MFGIFSQVQGWVKIKGASTGAFVGNVGDALKTNVTGTVLPPDAATQTTLEAARVLLNSLNGKDFATQATLNNVLSQLTTLNAKDFATQATLVSVLSQLTNLNAKDFALEATQSAINAKLNSLSSAPGTGALGLVVRQVPYELATFAVTAPAVVPANNKSMISIQNTGTSILKLREVWIINDQTTAVTGVAAEFRLHRINSFTGGTTLTPDLFDTLDTLPSGITVATGATASGESNLFRSGKWSSDEWGPGTLDVEASDHGFQQVEPFWRQTPSCKPITLRQNQGAHVRFATNSTAGAFNFRLVFTTE